MRLQLCRDEAGKREVMRREEVRWATLKKNASYRRRLVAAPRLTQGERDLFVGELESLHGNFPPFRKVVMPGFSNFDSCRLLGRGRHHK